MKRQHDIDQRDTTPISEMLDPARAFDPLAVTVRSVGDCLRSAFFPHQGGR